MALEVRSESLSGAGKKYGYLKNIPCVLDDLASL